MVEAVHLKVVRIINPESGDRNVAQDELPIPGSIFCHFG